jgi:hypothetical protein
MHACIQVVAERTAERKERRDNIQRASIMLEKREFKAGRMLQTNDNVLKPLPDKGVLMLEYFDEDGLLHLRWRNRAQVSIIYEYVCMYVHV